MAASCRGVLSVAEAHARRKRRARWRTAAPHRVPFLLRAFSSPPRLPIISRNLARPLNAAWCMAVMPARAQPSFVCPCSALRTQEHAPPRHGTLLVLGVDVHNALLENKVEHLLVAEPAARPEAVSGAAAAAAWPLRPLPPPTYAQWCRAVLPFLSFLVSWS